MLKGRHEIILTVSQNLVLKELFLTLHSMDPEIVVWLKCMYDCILTLKGTGEFVLPSKVAKCFQLLNLELLCGLLVH